MAENNDTQNGIKQAVLKKRERRVSAIWIVPIVALVIGIWLIAKTVYEKGPTVHITFRAATGIEAGKSLIKYKDIEVGKVTDVVFDKNLKSVIITAELKKEMKNYLGKGTRFWIVHARLSADAVEGLDTLFSGSYIQMDPHKGSAKHDTFKGLDNPPVISEFSKGKYFVLEADEKGSLKTGSPIYYKKLKAGSVTGYHLTPDGKKVLIDIFVTEPFMDLVSDTTRFWNTSGISATIGADGVEIQTESLISIMSGGIAFENFKEFKTGKIAEEGHRFILYDNLKKAKKITYKKELYFWVYFKESIRGLKIGSPVEFRGVKIGEVVNYSLIGDADSAEFTIPILIKIEPERFAIENSKGENNSSDIDPKIFKKLIDKGFRAQLQNGNLITGELFIDLDFHKDAKEAQLIKKRGFYVFPSIPATLESLKMDLKVLLTKLSAIPFEKIGKDLEKTIGGIKNDTVPKLNKLLKNLDGAAMNINRSYLDPNSAILKKLTKLMDELGKTSRSIKHLSDYLERHPESIIRGK